MPDSFDPIMLAWIGYAALGLVLMRLVTDPYFVWKEDQAEIGALKEQLNEPHHAMKRQMYTHLAEDRMRLVGYVSRVFNNLSDYLPKDSDEISKFERVSIELNSTEHLEDRFKFDPAFSVIWNHFYEALIKYVYAKPEPGNYNNYREYLGAMASHEESRPTKEYQAVIGWLVGSLEADGRSADSGQAGQ